MNTPEDTFRALKKFTIGQANHYWDSTFDEREYASRIFHEKFYESTGWTVEEFQNKYTRQRLDGRLR